MPIDESFKKLDEFRRSEGKRLSREVRRQSFVYILTAFGLVAGLAWNDAIKSLIEYFFPLSTNTLFAKFVYAVLITLFVVFVTVYFGKSENKTEE